MIDVSVEELKQLTFIEQSVTREFVGKPKDIRIWNNMCDELRTRFADAGFRISISMANDAGNNWIPMVTIEERTDSVHQKVIDTQGLDDERHVYEARHETSSDLEKQGLDTNLLLG